MEIKTGYFAKGKKYKELGYTIVSVARFNPRGWTGIHLIELAPQARLVFAYKEGQLSQEDFIDKYREYLSRNVYLIKSTIDDLKKFNVDKVVLCCYEKPSDFCHRHELAKFLNDNFNYNIEELIIN